MLKEIEEIGKEYAATGILKEVKEGTTSEGKTFVSGIITDKSGSLPFKVWDCTLATLKLEPSKVVSMKGELQVYSKSKYLKVNSQDNKPLIRMCPKANIKDYEVSAPLQITYNDLIEQLLTELDGSELRPLICGIYNPSYDVYFKEAPLSAECHSEKGGLLYHIINVFDMIDNYKVPTAIDGTEIVLEKVAMKLALLYASLANAHICTFNEDGTITDWNEPDKLLMAPYYVMSLIIEQLSKDNVLLSNIYKNFIHMVTVLSSGCKPATIEATVLTKLIADEKDIFKKMSELAVAEENSITKSKLVKLSYSSNDEEEKTDSSNSSEKTTDSDSKTA